MKKVTFLFASLCCSILSAQTQIGQNINGESAGDWSGVSVSMPNAQTIAIGAHNNNNLGNSTGRVKVFGWTGTAWQQRGTSIDGEAKGNEFGYSISMPDASTVAIGAPKNNENGSSAGHVRIYAWNGINWQQKGADIDGEATHDLSGWSVSMADANTVAIGGLGNDGNGTSSGHVRIYVWDGNSWTQKGADIDGEAAVDLSGYSVNMPDSNTVAIGAPFNDANGASAGQVRIFTWNGNNWTQKGADIDGEAAGDESGSSIDMPDVNTIAIGAHKNAQNGSNAGQVRIYTWDGNNWQQKGIDIDGNSSNDYLGTSVSMPNANTIAVGAPYNNGNGASSGRVRIFTWDGNNWQQKGINIGGESVGDASGYSVSMPDTNTVAIGAPNGYADDAGYTRVFNYVNTTINEHINNIEATVYPNPTKGKLTISFGHQQQNITITQTTLQGQVVATTSLKSGQKTTFNLQGAKGVYLVSIKTNTGSQLLKAFKE